MQDTKQSQKNRRISGPERVTWTTDYLRRYKAGETIRQISKDTGRSYGFVHRILTEAGVVLRPRGGARPRRSK